MEDFVTKGQESMKLTWRELADKAGVSRVALYRVKKGQVSEISVETAARVAAALNATIDKLFVINEDKKVTARADTERVKSLLREDIELCDLVEETVQELSIIFMLEERDPGGHIDLEEYSMLRTLERAGALLRDMLGDLYVLREILGSVKN